MTHSQGVPVTMSHDPHIRGTGHHRQERQPSPTVTLDNRWHSRQLHQTGFILAQILTQTIRRTSELHNMKGVFLPNIPI